MTNGEIYIRKSLRIKHDMADLEMFLLDNDAPDSILAAFLILRAKFDCLHRRFLDAYVSESDKDSKS